MTLDEEMLLLPYMKKKRRRKKDKVQRKFRSSITFAILSLLWVALLPPNVRNFISPTNTHIQGTTILPFSLYNNDIDIILGVSL